MSHVQIDHSEDLKSLRDEGYEVEVSDGYLLISHVPYVNSDKKVAYGTLISTLDLSNDKTIRPSTHVVLWAGDYPCDSTGSQLTNLVNQTLQQQIRDGLVATHSFSQKPAEGYRDYHHKMTSYIRILEGKARVLDPNTTARTFPVIRPAADESVFHYIDNASSRAGITTINKKLEKERIGIVGLGGTGSYILDLVAKTPVQEIHLFDGDDFLQHNAFRSPGAPSADDLERKLKKVAWFAENYSRMRKNIYPHSEFIDDTNASELKAMDFVFLCIEGKPKQKIVEYLLQNNVPFIDVGMGLYAEGEALAGLVRVTTCTPSFHEHALKRIPFSDGEDNEYSRNIQIADMNALNAVLAVIKWKKICGFYIDLEHEHHTVYGINSNVFTNELFQNEEKADPPKVC